MKDKQQQKLFGADEVPTKFDEHWQDMPEYTQGDLTPELSIIVHFNNAEDRQAFAKLVNQTITYRTKSIWYPKAEIGVVKDKRWVDES